MPKATYRSRRLPCARRALPCGRRPPYLVIPSHCELIVIADNDNLQEPDDVKEYNVVLDSADLMWAKIKEAAQCGLLTKNRNPDFDNQ